MSNHHYCSGYLLLEDGSVYRGDAFRGVEPAIGEVVFNTSCSGYQEILTDPSYHRQLVVFTSPHIGNVGVNREDQESGRVQAAGAIIRSLPRLPRSWRAETGLAEYLEQARAPFLVGVDTRTVTLHIRRRGAMRAGLFPGDTPLPEALEKILQSPVMSGANLAGEVSCRQPYRYDPGESTRRWDNLTSEGEQLRVAVLDFGVKLSILRQLWSRGCEVWVFPQETPADELLAGGFDGVLLSNGPGDPAAVVEGAGTVHSLLGRIPLFGICLGHQLLSLAAGMETFKLNFGHRGANHPVRNMEAEMVEITSQNHGFAVRPDPLPQGWKITHWNLNDHTVEGLSHEELPVFSLQYHPEAGPGPHEGGMYFDHFIQVMRNAQE